MQIKVPAVCALCAVMTLNASAQKYRDGVHGGFVTGGDVRNEGFAFGYQASMLVSDYLSFEFSITRQDDELEGRIDELSIPADFSYDLETYSLALSARLGFELWDRMRFYASAGAGYYVMDADSEEVRETIAANQPVPPPASRLVEMDIDVDNDFGVHLGGGIAIDLTERWELFADYRHVSLEPDADLVSVEQRPSIYPRTPFDRVQTIRADKLEYEHDLVRVGLNYWF